MVYQSTVPPTWGSALTAAVRASSLSWLGLGSGLGFGFGFGSGLELWLGCLSGDGSVVESGRRGCDHVDGERACLGSGFGFGSGSGLGLGFGLGFGLPREGVGEQRRLDHDERVGRVLSGEG